MGCLAEAASLSFYLREKLPLSMVQKAWWESGPVCTGVWNRKSLTATSVETPNRLAVAKPLYRLRYPGSIMGVGTQCINVT